MTFRRLKLAKYLKIVRIDDQISFNEVYDLRIALRLARFASMESLETVKMRTNKRELLKSQA